jgi:DNA adenine methylase
MAQKNVTTKPLVRYPGSKARKTKKLTNMFPEFTGNFYEPFIGSGVVSIYQQEINPNRNIYINDIYPELYNLWVQVRDNAEELVESCLLIRKKYPADNTDLAKDLYNKMTELQEKGNNLGQAVAFFVKNKISFSGLGGVTKLAYQKTFNDGNTKKILEISRIIQNFNISNIDYEELLSNCDENDFVFLDPPYDIKDVLYGKNGEIHAGFDHNRFCKVVKSLPCKWLITYNDNEVLREYYKDYNILDEEYNYCMSFKTTEEGKKQRKKNELIITNY